LLRADWRTSIAANLPDLPFYAIYPLWVIAHPSTGITTPAPRALTLIHRALHSLPLAFLIAWLLRLPKLWLAAWCLHILIDIPTHQRGTWATRFLFPISSYTVNGWDWGTATLNLLQRKSAPSLGAP